mmetsp:Transcript_37769/g.108868  ORF Transcript_37769/g.108868 Transcript_37769/m.108868 type:complete len:940 (+) Transcript_37769:43-2862(+)
MAPEGGDTEEKRSQDNPSEPVSAEDWKRQGGEAYKEKNWKEAVHCYTAALEHCKPDSDLGVTCLNNRAACYAQLKSHVAVIKDTNEVISKQPANVKALLRRMVAYEATGLREKALQDAGAVLTMEPRNPAALEVVARKRQSLTKKATDDLPVFAADRPTENLCVFLFSEDRPLQCYACLRSFFKHAKRAVLNVYVFWQASSPACIHSYQLLQGLPETSKLKYGKVNWFECSNQQLFPAFSRTMNKISVEGMQYVLLLSDKTVFHSDFDATAALSVLAERREAWSVRLDVNPRVEYFPEAKLIASAPHLQHFSGDQRILLWTRWYDKSKQAYEAVPREMGWDAILDWTATIVRAELMQHFFSALIPPLNNVTELDEKAADWLSRRQRMKRTELSQRSACYEQPMLVTLDPAEFGDPEAADRLLRAHLYQCFGPKGNEGQNKFNTLAQQTSWKLQEITDYFKDVDTQGPGAALAGLLLPEAYRESYFNSVRVSATPPPSALPKALNPPGPLVSWLVPARNSESFVIDCLASIDAQTGIGAGCCEIVFVDDGSEDQTLAVLRKLAGERPDVRIVENAVQLGVAGSLCEGWPQCRGDFVARMDADDEAEPDRLLKQLRYLEQHPSITVLGSKTRPFWTELRKCTIDRVAEKDNGRVVAVAWREDFGNQTSRKREQITMYRKGDQILLQEGPAEYHGCQVVRVGEESLSLNPERWVEALKAVQGKKGEVILQRRDPVEPPRGSRALHPLRVRALLVFEDCVSGTTATLRREHFGEKCPFQREEAETHWCWLTLEPRHHIANLADALVRTRRHAGNRADRDASGIYESRCAAVQYHLTKVHGVEVDMHDAAALMNFRGPRTPEQGQKLIEVLHQVERAYHSEILRPPVDSRGEFFEDYVKGREVALERMLFATRNRFKEVSDRISEVITSGEKSPREHRSRTPPR